MKSAPAHTLGEAVASGHTSCNGCKSPDASLLEEEFIVWLDGSGTAHLSDECPAFSGSWKLSSARDAIDSGAAACAECDAERYLAAIAAGGDVTVTDPDAEPTPEPTEEPTPEPTDKPTPEPTGTPKAKATTVPTLKPAGKATANPAA